jgi:hypothetical protein
VCFSLGVSAHGEAQESHRLDDRQRAQILSLIKAVDAAQANPAVVGSAGGAWSMHILKSSAGLNYVPMMLTMDVAGAAGEAGIYVRVAAKPKDGASVSSALERWLVTEAIKSAPRPMPYQGFVAVNPDEMPVGLTSSSRRQAVSAPGGSTTALTLYERQQLRAEEERRRSEKAAKDEEDRPDAKKPVDEFIYPFEDFGFTSLRAEGRPGSIRVERALVVPPGEYDLYVAASAAGEAPTIRRSSLSVPSYDRDELMLSSIILAERLESLPKPYSAQEQSSHPYALGWTQIVPARDTSFTDAEQLGVVFQVLNPVPDARRKPDVTVEYDFHLTNGAADVVTARHDFNSRTLPDEFDLEKGHQVFAAQAVPLKSFAPGRYRLEVRVTDNVARRTVSRTLDVSVRATSGSIWLAKAVDGLLAPAFRRDQVLGTRAVGQALDELAAFEPLTPRMAAALSEARAGRYATVLGAVPAGTDLASSFLRGLALMALSENLEPAAAQFREALRFASDFVPATVYLGACFAANGRDREAIAAWQLAGAADSATPFVSELLSDALMRAKNHEVALGVLTDALSRWPDEPSLARRMAAARIAGGSRDDGLAALETLLSKHGEDLDALFLAIYLLASDPSGPRLEPSGGERLARYARAYVEARGPHRAIVEQWLEEAQSRN